MSLLNKVGQIFKNALLKATDFVRAVPLNKSTFTQVLQVRGDQHLGHCQRVRPYAAFVFRVDRLPTAIDGEQLSRHEINAHDAVARFAILANFKELTAVPAL